MRKSFKVFLGTMLSLVVIVAAFLVYINIEGPHSDVSVFWSELAVLQPKQIKIDGFNVIAQPDAASCGITTISMIETYLSGVSTEPNRLIQKYDLKGGMKADRFSEILSSELPGYETEYKYNLSDADLIKEIHAQLCSGMPVAVFFGAENPYNKPYYDFHASAIIGIDLENQTIEIANAYGYNETISLNQFLDRSSYRETSKFPLIQRAVLKLGFMDKNTIFVFHKV